MQPNDLAKMPIVRLKYFLRIKNVGDRINPNILSLVFSYQSRYYGGDTEQHLVAIGSIISGTNALSHVWGTGLMYPQNGIGQATAQRIYALRGKLTYRAVEEGGLTLRDIPLGDPAYLISNTHFRYRRAKKYRLGLVAHYVDRNDPRVTQLLAEDGVADLNVHEDPELFLVQMAECETIASSSLHGLIFAEALEIPNVWLHLSDRVVGDGFKFHDWFSTTGKPQLVPFSPTADDRAIEFVKRAVLHDCRIDRRALIDAFPRHKLEELTYRNPNVRPFVNLWQSRKYRQIPIFVISYNRSSYLTRVIRSYLRLSEHVRIIIHDNGSDHPATLRTLRLFEESGSILVFRSRKITHPDDLNNVNETVSAYFSNWAEPSRYVVTDCDVDMSTASPDALQIFGELLDQFRAAQCVGPMLTIRDIRVDYPLYNNVMNRHIEQFWCQEPEWAMTSKGQVGILRASIDTTFAMHRAGEPFHRLKDGLRVYYPYEARHLDWYENFDNTDYPSTSSSEISHWSNGDYIEQHKNVPLQFEHFFYVENSGLSGNLISRTRYIKPALTHAVIIGFHYPDSYPRDKLEWRFSYFRSMVLPRILRQTIQSFVIAVRTTPVFAQRFRELSDRIITFDVKPGFENWIPPGYDPEEFEINRRRCFVDFVPWEAIEGLKQYDIQTSVDSDDLLLREDFIDRIEKECYATPPNQSLHIHFQPYIYDVPSLSFYNLPVPYDRENGSQFFSLYQPDKDGFVFVGQDSHRRIGKLMERSVIIDPGYVGFSIHWANASSSLYPGAEKITLP